ncbi:MAG: LptF/LptG family permease [Bacteroidota bacterium]|nr:LptF/LptG family permease [Bacteroidota bacterium]
MKKLDKLILRSFLGPFLLTFLVVVFILLTQHMLKYFDEFVGKDLGILVFAQLLSYFAINMTPIAFPLAVLLSSLMTFGNLGEHFELTAIKSSGISLTRALLPIFFFASILTVVAFYSNNFIVPKVNLKAYSLLYDIRQKKPSMDLKEGAFYNGIPGYSIKANKKFPDGITLKDLIIYDHTKGMGNTDVIIADSGKMFTIHNDRYLLLEMFEGNMYSQTTSSNNNQYGSEPDEFIRNKFFKTKIVFSLVSFDLQRTDEQLFATNRLMKNVTQLNYDIDSMRTDASEIMHGIYMNANRFFQYHLQEPLEIPGHYKARPINHPIAIQAFIEADNPSNKERLKKIENKPKTKILSQKEIKADSVKSIASNTTTSSKNSTKIAKNAAQQKNIAKKENTLKPTPKPGYKNKDIAQRQSTGANKKSLERNELKVNNPDSLKVGLEQDTTDFSDSLKAEANIVKVPNAGSLRLVADSVRAASFARLDSAFNQPQNKAKALSLAVGQARHNKNSLMTQTVKLNHLLREARVYDIEKHKKYTQAAACVVMFLIGAPLGAIIKKGGLGVPVIVSIIFFIIFYVASILGEKWGREDIIDPALGAWGANLILLPFGFLFLRQARNDARLFEADFYKVYFSNLKKKLGFEKPKKKFDPNTV